MLDVVDLSFGCLYVVCEKSFLLDSRAADMRGSKCVERIDIFFKPHGCISPGCKPDGCFPHCDRIKIGYFYDDVGRLIRDS